ncbi:hypothetical protein SCHPADRAFT_864940, partial [Schizopora paradoxa]
MACYNCFTVAPKLQKCSRCKRIRYCNDACQKANFSEHKWFCKNLARVHSYSGGGLSETAGPLETIQLHVRMGSSLTIALLQTEEDISQNDKNLVVFEPRCAICYRSEYDMRRQRPTDDDDTGTGPSYGSLISCSTCLGAFACSPAHWAVYEQEHKAKMGEEGVPGLSECDLNIRAAEDDDFTVLTGAHRPPWAPERRRVTYEALPAADAASGVSAWDKWWADPVNTREVPAPGFPEVAKRACSQALSIPLTILYGIGLFDELAKGDGTLPLHERTELEVAILGAASYEFVAGGMGFEELLHSLPSVRKLTVRLVGPELQRIAAYDADGMPMDMDTCPSCAEQNITRVHIHHGDTFHDYIESVGPAARRMPDIAVAFNSGMHENDFSKKSWARTIKMLVKKSVPTIATSYQSKEAEADFAFLQELGCRIVISPHVNPWRSELAIKEPFGARGFYFQNGFIQGFKGKA